MPAVKHKKGPKRRQPVWGPPSVAGWLGRDWAAMSTEERKLLSDACRFLHNQHQRILNRRRTVSLDTQEKSS